MFEVLTPHRGQDEYGSGAWGASRGNRIHKGIDFAASPGSGLKSNVNGTVTKLGYPYTHALQFRYVEITDASQMRHRFFYVNPLVEVGQTVKAGQVIGRVQDISGHYSDKHMINHFHYEIKQADDSHINPNGFLNEKPIK